MLVSILIPTYNRAGLLREALQSAREQDYREIEILVSDDGSKDETLRVIEEVSQADPRVRLVPKNPTPGLFENVNHLISHSKGEAVAILADDDRLEPDFVSTLLAPLQADEAVVSTFCSHWMVAANGERDHRSSDYNDRIHGRDQLPAGVVARAELIALAGALCMGAALFRGAVIRARPFDVAVGPAADRDLAIQLSRAGKIVYVPGRPVEIRDHPGRVTNTQLTKVIDSITHLLERERFDDPAAESERRRLLRSKHRVRALYWSGVDREIARTSLERFHAMGGAHRDPVALVVRFLQACPPAVAQKLATAIRFWGRKAQIVSRVLSKSYYVSTGR